MHDKCEILILFISKNFKGHENIYRTETRNEKIDWWENQSIYNSVLLER